MLLDLFTFLINKFVSMNTVDNCYLQILSLWSRSVDNSYQEAQLLQRDRATLCVIEYFAKSLKVIRNDTVEYGLCKPVLVFH